MHDYVFYCIIFILYFIVHMCECHMYQILTYLFKTGIRVLVPDSNTAFDVRFYSNNITHSIGCFIHVLPYGQKSSVIIPYFPFVGTEIY